jgi:hypothetical protein
MGEFGRPLELEWGFHASAAGFDFNDGSFPWWVRWGGGHMLDVITVVDWWVLMKLGHG